MPGYCIIVVCKTRAGDDGLPPEPPWHVIPALTDHLEDKGGVIGLGIVRLTAKHRQPFHNPSFHIGDDRCSGATAFPQKDSFLLLFIREIATLPFFAPIFLSLANHEPVAASRFVCSVMWQAALAEVAAIAHA
jgi:hypothetical protein